MSPLVGAGQRLVPEPAVAIAATSACRPSRAMRQRGARRCRWRASGKRRRPHVSAKRHPRGAMGCRHIRGTVARRRTSRPGLGGCGRARVDSIVEPPLLFAAHSCHGRPRPHLPRSIRSCRPVTVEIAGSTGSGRHERTALPLNRTGDRWHRHPRRPPTDSAEHSHQSRRWWRVAAGTATGIQRLARMHSASHSRGAIALLATKGTARRDLSEWMRWPCSGNPSRAGQGRGVELVPADATAWDVSIQHGSESAVVPAPDQVGELVHDHVLEARQRLRRQLEVEPGAAGPRVAAAPAGRHPPHAPGGHVC